MMPFSIILLHRVIRTHVRLSRDRNTYPFWEGSQKNNLLLSKILSRRCLCILLSLMRCGTFPWHYIVCQVWIPACTWLGTVEWWNQMLGAEMIKNSFLTYAWIKWPILTWDLLKQETTKILESRKYTVYYQLQIAKIGLTLLVFHPSFLPVRSRFFF